MFFYTYAHTVILFSETFVMPKDIKAHYKQCFCRTSAKVFQLETSLTK